MTQIKIQKCASSVLMSELEGVAAITVGAELGKGGFGEVYRCSLLDGGTPSESLAVKVFFRNAPQASWETVKSLIDAVSSSRNRREILKLPALSALPLMAFEGNRGGEAVRGFIMRELRIATSAQPDGHVPFARIRERSSPENEPFRGAYMQLSAVSRLHLCEQLVEAMDCLSSVEDLQFIHADLNPVNILVNVAKERLAVIDFDAGAVTRRGQEVSTRGKDDVFAAPEIAHEVSRGETTVPVNLYTDRWSIAALIHNLLFPQVPDPYFFLHRKSAPLMREYHELFKWPEADASISNYRSQYSDQHENYCAHLKQVRFNQIVDLLRRAFSEGYFEPPKRPTYYEWLEAIRQAKTLGSRQSHSGPKQSASSGRRPSRPQLAGIRPTRRPTAVSPPPARAPVAAQPATHGVQKPLPGPLPSPPAPSPTSRPAPSVARGKRLLPLALVAAVAVPSSLYLAGQLNPPGTTTQAVSTVPVVPPASQMTKPDQRASWSGRRRFLGDLSLADAKKRAVEIIVEPEPVKVGATRQEVVAEIRTTTQVSRTDGYIDLVTSTLHLESGMSFAIVSNPNVNWLSLNALDPVRGTLWESE